MKFSAEQYFALDQMGIPVWVTRQDEAVDIAKKYNDTSEIENIDVEKSWLVIVENTLSATENRLLRAIFGSINIQFDKVAVLERQHLKVLDRFSADKPIVLVLGEELSQKLNLQTDDSLSCLQLENKLLALVGQSLQQLLEQPQRKSNMWQTIIQLRNLKAHQLD